MIEEPFLYVEAIANRREYIETQLAVGSPIVACNYREGILLFTLSRERQKLFEVYDRIAMGAIGHPGDIERLRMTAIELASTEGFTRSGHDVSLRRMANYSLSPALKAAFEAVYKPPYLGRLLFVELGDKQSDNTFLRIDYDGDIQSNGTPQLKNRKEYATLAGTKIAAEQMDKYFEKHFHANLDLSAALELCFTAWIVGRLAGAESEPPADLPDDAAIRVRQKEELKQAAIETAVLDSSVKSTVKFHAVGESDIKKLIDSISK